MRRLAIAVLVIVIALLAGCTSTGDVITYLGKPTVPPGKPTKTPKPSPTPTATTPPPSPTPTPTATTPPPSPSPTPTGTPTGTPCYAEGDHGCPTAPIDGHSGYLYSKITNSNGWNTYVVNDMWACGDGSCGPQSITVYDPGNWSMTSDQTAGNTAVRSYPDVQQLTNNWDGTGFHGSQYVPISAMASITSNYVENMHANSGTIAQAAYDIWTSSGEVMIWVDTTDLRGDGGATKHGTGTIGGLPFTFYTYGGDEKIIKLDSNLQAGTIDILDGLKWLQANGYVATNATISQINFGWEVCSTNGVPETFNISDYSLTLTPG